MTTLNDIVPPTRITRADREYKTTYREWPNGRDTVKRHRIYPKHEWDVEWDGITLEEFEALCDHFDSVFGRFGVFQFIDTHNGLTYNVRYADDTLSRRNVHRNVRGLYYIRLRLREDKQ